MGSPSAPVAGRADGADGGPSGRRWRASTLAPEPSFATPGRALVLASVAERWTVPVGAAVAVGGLLAANGGYFPVSWGWATLALLWAAAIGLLLRAPRRLGRVEAVFAGALVGLVGWVWLSVAWSSDLTQSVFDGERSLVLLAAAAAGLVLVPRRPVRPLLGGVLAGIVAISAYALATRLLPSRVGTYDALALYRLNTPVGYWNGLGITAAMGSLLALGFALRASRRAARVLAAASLLVLLPTLYFTYSRGSWIALGVGLAAALALDGRRFELATGALVLAPAPALAVWLASQSHALTRQASTLAAAKHDGHRIALAVVLFALLEAVLAVAFEVARRRLTPPRWARLAWASLLVAVLLAMLGGLFARYGSPPTMARRAYHAFQGPPRTGPNLNTRLFSLSGNGRADLWGAAWQQAQAHPLLGAGAGSYGRYWLRHRPNNLNVQDAHNLYLETLAELGPLGLALLLLVLGAPLLGAVRARRRPLVPLACAAYVAFLVHAAADWDWELAGLTLAALFCGVACLLAGRRPGGAVLGPRARAVGVAASMLLSALAVVGLLGNSALEASDAAARAGNWHAAQRHARTAIRWTPWSADGWQRLAEAQIGLHEYAAARRSLERAIAKDRGDWVLWLDLAQASRGSARAAAVKEVLRLNPRDASLIPLVIGIRP
jgi:hypothetical protein